jgi:hypothetical protein
LRRQGQNYAKIACVLGLAASNVKSFCWRNVLSDKELTGAANADKKGFVFLLIKKEESLLK